MKQRIHIFGASGSGTTTLAQELCKKLGYHHIDTDNFYWYDTTPPFTHKRPIPERIRLMEQEMDSHECWINSGSLSGWGNVFIPRFQLVIFLYLPAKERMERLRKREYERYGDATLPGGNAYEREKAFLAWAAGYDTALPEDEGRNYHKHLAWMNHIQCPLLKITGVYSMEATLEKAIRAITSE